MSNGITSYDSEGGGGDSDVGVWIVELIITGKHPFTKCAMCQSL